MWASCSWTLGSAGLSASARRASASADVGSPRHSIRMTPRAEAAVGKVEGQIVAAQVQLIRLDVPGPVAQEVAAGAPLQSHLQLAGNRAGQLVLRRENVFHVPIVGCRPAGRAVARVDESDLEAQ